MLEYTYKFFFYSACTIVIETVVLFLLIRKGFKIDGSTVATKKIIIAGIFASMITLPYVWYILPILVYWSYGLQVIFSEVLAVVVEALFYGLFLIPRWKRAIVLSVICNAVSFFLMLLLNTIPAFSEFVSWVVS